MRLLTDNGGWHERMPDHQELEFQRLLMKMSGELWPGYRYGSWSPSIRSSYGPIAQPDAILWKEHTKEWYVVEVELSGHSLQHIARQTDTLVSGVYDYTLAPAVASALSLDNESAASLLVSKPGFLAIFDENREKVTRAARDNGFDICIAEPFRNAQGRSALVVHKMPRILTEPSAMGFAIIVQQGMGDTAVVVIPAWKEIPDGTLKITLPDGSDVCVTCHSGRMWIKRSLIEGYSALRAQVVSSSPFRIKLSEGT